VHTEVVLCGLAQDLFWFLLFLISASTEKFVVL